MNLKDYKIVEKIKDGSVGAVYRATHPRYKTIAIKVLHPKHVGIARKIRRFRKEAQLGARFRHANIIKVYEYVNVKPQPFFSMEYFDSEELKYAMWHLTERVHTYEFYILRQVAQALEFIHRQGIIHKDLKPENVLVGRDSKIRLIDFSLGQSKVDRLLQFGRRTEGTPLYMAPEQIQGVRCDPRTDIYAFGILIYELLAKRPPFLGTTERNLLEKHVKEPPPPIRKFVKTLAPELEAFIARLLSKRREDRPQSMTDVIFELSRWEKKDTVVRLKQVEPAKDQQAREAGR